MKPCLRLLLLVLMGILSSGAAEAQRRTVMSLISTDSMLQTVKELTGAIPVTVDGIHDTITTRMVYTTGNRLASRYILQRMRSFGLEAELQPFEGEYTTLPLNFTGLSRTPGSTLLWLCSDYGEVFSSADSGGNWTSRLRSAVPDIDRLDWICALGPSLVAAMGRTGRLATTADGGLTWTRKNTGISNVVHFAGSTGGILIAVVSDGVIWRSPDFGGEWSPVLVDAGTALARVEFLDGQHTLLAGTEVSSGSGRLFESTDAGTTWRAFDSDWGAGITALCATDSLHAWLATGGSECYFTKSGGTAWAHAAFADTEVAKTIFFGDSLNGWIVTLSGTLYRSTDGGQHWGLAYRFDAPLTVSDLQFIDPINGVVVGKQFSGYRTRDGGSSWTNETVPLLSNVIATSRGTRYPEAYFILTAHSDCDVLIKAGWLKAPGADDDASGTASLIELARVFSRRPLPCTIKFVALPDEEWGGIGTFACAGKLLNEPGDPRLLLDFDMVGFDSLYPGALNVSGSSGIQTARARDLLRTIVSQEQVPLRLVETPGVLPANAAGFASQVASIGFMESEGIGSFTNPHYHSHGDVWSTLNPVYLADVTRAAAGLLYDLGTSPGRVTVSPAALQFGNVELGQTGDTLMVHMGNWGMNDVQLTSFTWGNQAFSVPQFSGMPLIVPPLGFDLSVVFAPTERGIALDTLLIATSDSTNPAIRIPLSGAGVVVDTALPLVMYGVYNSLYTIDRPTGAVALVGPLGVQAMQSIAVRPATQGLYGVSTGTSTTAVYRVSSSTGAAVHACTTPLGSIRAVAFSESGDTMFAGSGSGRLYVLNPTTGDTTYIGAASGVNYKCFTPRPGTSELWALTGNAIVQVDKQSGDTSLVVTLPYSDLQAISFDASGRLLGLKGIFTTNLVVIDMESGVTTQIGSAGTRLSGLAMRTDVVDAVTEWGPSIPPLFTLFQNYPNPFNPSTAIRYGLPGRSHVTLTVFNALGQQVATLVDGDMEAGYHEVTFDPAHLASGVYLCKLRAGDFVAVRKMLFVR